LEFGGGLLALLSAWTGLVTAANLAFINPPNCNGLSHETQRLVGILVLAVLVFYSLWQAAWSFLRRKPAPQTNPLHL